MTGASGSSLRSSASTDSPPTPESNRRMGESDLMESPNPVRPERVEGPSFTSGAAQKEERPFDKLRSDGYGRFRGVDVRLVCQLCPRFDPVRADPDAVDRGGRLARDRL